MNRPLTISLEELRRIIQYDPETGLFLKKGRAFGSPRKRDGYIQMRVGDRVLTGHRLAWFYVHGEWPGSIDHINGDRSDNRIANLRSVKQSENLQNIRLPKRNNTTGHLGVSFDPDRGKFIASISVDGKTKNLGRFTSAEAAHAKYLAAKRELHPYSTI